jgi:arylsulfatase A-like enzyme
MNIVLIVVDSLRACSLEGHDDAAPRTPFLDGLADRTLAFSRAYATECWTLPTHVSMFTGLLPSAHGAHFQTMAYTRAAPTAAEVLARAGYHTEVVTRNSLFDGTVPGVTRGFQRNTQVLADLGAAAAPLALLVTLAKPRVRRLMRTSGFFHALQRERREFLYTLARMGIPADRMALDHALEQMATLRRRGKPYFLFLNLYDVHAPYSPSPRSPLRPWTSLRGWRENLTLPWLLPRVSSHAYLRPGFRMSPSGRRLLLDRYHRAIELMDAKLADFYAAARSAGLLDDTLLVVTADHGEAFGEHDLYFHDASVYETHLRVPLWVHHPDQAAGVVTDTVTTRDLFALLCGVGLRRRVAGTILDPATRARRAVAAAEHFHYPHTAGLLGRYTQNLAAAVVGGRKLIIRREGPELYDLDRDPHERSPERATIAAFEAVCRRDGAPAAAIAEAVGHLRRWETTAAAAPARRLHAAPAA